jgi:predicted TIM-barrel fold metal-dependent hydrolase
LPAGSCDAHTHIFGPSDRFPFAPDRSYTPHDAPFDALLALHRQLGISRGVLVQAGCHGYDMSAILDALSRSGGQYRAVALLRAQATVEDVAALDAAGVRGVRFNFVAHLQNESWESVQRVAALIEPFGWHLCFHTDKESLPALLPKMQRLPVPFVLDHMGRIAAANGINDPLFQGVLKLAGQAGAWVKVSGLDRISSGGVRPFDDGRPFVQALVNSMADHLLWGTDWPHPNVRTEMPDDAQLLNTLLQVCPHPDDLQRILVDNPQRLYRFDETLLLGDEQ